MIDVVALVKITGTDGTSSFEEESNDEDKVLDQLVKNAEEIHKF